MITDAQLRDWFTYHPPKPEQTPQFELIRAQGLAFARVIVDNTPPGADQSAAIRKVREAVMTANAAIACEPEPTTADEELRRAARKADAAGRADAGPEEGPRHKRQQPFSDVFGDILLGRTPREKDPMDELGEAFGDVLDRVVDWMERNGRPKP